MPGSRDDALRRRRPQPAVRHPGPADGLHRPRRADRRHARLGPRQGAGRWARSSASAGARPTTSTPCSRRWSTSTCSKHGGDPERSLAAVGVARHGPRATCERSPTPTCRPAWPASRTAPRRRRTTPRRPRPTRASAARRRGPRSASSGRTPGAASGEVFVACDEELHREVALKEIQADHADDPDSRARFLLRGGGHRRAGAPRASCRSTAWATTPTAGPSTPCGSSRATASRRPSSASTPPTRPGRDPGERTLELRRLLAPVRRRLQRGGLRPQPGGAAPRPQAGATSCSASTARRWSSTGAWPRSSAGTRRPRRRRGGDACGRRRPARSQRDAGGLGDRHAGVHEPRAGRGAARPARPGQRRLQPGGDALLPADRPAAVRGATSARSCGRVAARRVPAAAAGRPGGAARRWRRSA